MRATGLFLNAILRPRSLKIMSWSLDMSESTTFAPATEVKPASHYFNQLDLQDNAWRESQNKFKKQVHSKELSSSSFSPTEPLFTSTTRRRRIPKRTRLNHICQTIAAEAPDILCLQDCDANAIDRISSLAIPETSGNHHGKFSLINAVSVEGTGLTASFIKEVSDGGPEQQPFWQLQSSNPLMPFSTFTVNRASISSFGQNILPRSQLPLVITNVDLTPVVRDLKLEGFVSADNNSLNRSFYSAICNENDGVGNAKHKRGKGGGGGMMMPTQHSADPFTQQREAALALIARGASRKFRLSTNHAKLSKEAKMSALKSYGVPDIIIGNSHLRHGWTRDRMSAVLPSYLDAWEMAGRPVSDWESYAFYSPSASQMSQTNCRYFDDEIPSRAKGGRYEKCFLRANRFAGMTVSVRVPRPMVEENCSCSDQFPLIVNIEEKE